MTDKHTNSFEERNFKTQQDQADFRMQQMLKEKGFVRGASESDLEKYPHIAGSYQKVGTDPKDGFVPKFYDVRKVLLIPDYVIYPRDSVKLFLSEVKGTNKLKEDDFNSLYEMQQRAEKFNETSMSITMEVGLWWFRIRVKIKLESITRILVLKVNGCQMLILKFMREKWIQKAILRDIRK